MRGLVEACWVRHPTEWGGEERVVPPARDGQEARWTPLCGVLLRHVGLDTPRSGVEKRVWSPPARDGQEARWTPLCGVLLMAACWVGHPWRGGEESVVPPPPAMGRRRGGHPLCGVL